MHADRRRLTIFGVRNFVAQPSADSYLLQLN